MSSVARAVEFHVSKEGKKISQGFWLVNVRIYDYCFI